MNALLIAEPPLQVLRSLAMKIGLNEAIVLQQAHYIGRNRTDGWIEQPLVAWRVHFPFWSPRTLERVLANLVELGLLDREETAGRPSRYRVAYTHAILAGLSDNVTGDPRQSDEGSSVSLRERTNKREKNNARKRAPLSPAEEVEGFGQWLGQHVVIAVGYGLALSVPRAATARRTALHRTFVRLRQEGMGLDEFELASRGLLGDEWMRDNGHVQPESVLRVEKVGKWVDAGRALAEAPAGKYAHLESGA